MLRIYKKRNNIGLITFKGKKMSSWKGYCGLATNIHTTQAREVTNTRCNLLSWICKLNKVQQQSVRWLLLPVYQFSWFKNFTFILVWMPLLTACTEHCSAMERLILTNGPVFIITLNVQPSGLEHLPYINRMVIKFYRQCSLYQHETAAGKRKLRTGSDHVHGDRVSKARLPAAPSTF